MRSMLLKDKNLDHLNLKNIQWVIVDGEYGTVGVKAEKNEPKKQTEEYY
jgi:hypothetical protein